MRRGPLQRQCNYIEGSKPEDQGDLAHEWLTVIDRFPSARAKMCQSQAVLRRKRQATTWQLRFGRINYRCKPIKRLLLHQALDCFRRPKRTGGLVDPSLALSGEKDSTAVVRCPSDRLDWIRSRVTEEKDSCIVLSSATLLSVHRAAAHAVTTLVAARSSGTDLLGTRLVKLNLKRKRDEQFLQTSCATALASDNISPLSVISAALARMFRPFYALHRPETALCSDLCPSCA